MRAQSVNNIKFLTADDIIDKNVIDSIWFNNFMVEYIMHEYAFENNLDIEDLDIDNLEESEHFTNFFEQTIKYKINEIIDTLKEIQYDNIISIWRHMLVDNNWLDHLITYGKRLGIYWSWDKENAEPYWGFNDDNKKILVILESKIHVDNVDWRETILTNLNNEEESEIRLYKNTPIEIISLEVDGKDVTSTLKHKIYKA